MTSPPREPWDAGTLYLIVCVVICIVILAALGQF